MARYIIFGRGPDREILRILDEDPDGGILAEAEEDWITYMPRTYLDKYRHTLIW